MASENPFLIEVKNLSKAFGGTFALDDMSMNVPEGSIYGLIGPNGAGKTTLLRHIAGACRPDKGRVFVGGEPVWENPRTKARIVFVPDDPHFDSYEKSGDLAAFYKGVYKNFDQKRFRDLLSVFGLDPDKRAGGFSRGMKKQMALILAICSTPDILLLDEPVDGLDPIARRRFWDQILQDVADKRTTIMISSHNLRELDDICDHIGIISRGKLLLEKPVDDLMCEFTKLRLAFADGIFSAHANESGDAQSPNGISEVPSPDGTNGVPSPDGTNGAQSPDGIGGAQPPDGIGGEQSFDEFIGGLFPGMQILRSTQNGRLIELVVKGGADEILSSINSLSPPPAYTETAPLTLEEIFVFELEGTHYAETIIR